MGQGDRVQRPAATIGEENKIARVAAVLDGLTPDGTRHDDGRDGDNTVGHLDRAVIAGIA